MNKITRTASITPGIAALPLPAPRQQTVLSGPTRSCLTIKDIDDEEAAIWDALVVQRGGRLV